MLSKLVKTARVMHRISALACATVLALVMTDVPAPAQPEGPGRSEQAERAKGLTQDLLAQLDQFRNVHAADRAAAVGNLARTAAARFESLQGLIETDPGEVLRLSIPASARAGFPGEARAWIEEEVKLEGELEILYEEGITESRLLYGLETNRGRFSLHFARELPADLETGSRVRVHGVRVGTALALASGTSGESLQALAPSLPNTFGEQKTAVILVNFQDNSSTPYTLDYASGVVFGTTSDWDKENSQNQTWLTGNVFGWYTIPVSSTVCDYNSIATYAKQAAAGAGNDLSSYRRFVYGFPNNACSWWGLGSVGGNPSSAWINGSFTLKVVGHEMGHNFGLYHSRTATNEYGDVLDIMGNPSSDHFNAFQKERLGWLNYGSLPSITTVQGEGDYPLTPYAALDSGPKALKVLKSTDSSTGQRTWYYVEHRRGVGFDSSVGSNANVLNGVVVHTGSESTGNSSFLLDMTPDTATFNDPALTVGNSFSDTAAGVTITTLSTSTGGASVRVTMATQPCVPAAPTLNTSSPSLSGPAGKTLRYTLTLTNKDGSACAATTFNLGASVPTGWTAVVNPASVSLASGAGATVTVDVTSSSSAADNLYDVVVTATASADAGKTVSTTLSYIVSTPVCVPGTSSLTSASSTQSGAAGSTLSYAFTLANGDGSACAATTYGITAAVPTGWSVVVTPTSVTLSGGASASITVKVTSPASTGDGTYYADVAATSSDGTETVSAKATCVISTALSASVATDKTSYSPNQTVTVTSTVKMNGSPVSGAKVSFTITRSDNTSVSATLTTGRKGTAIYKYRVAAQDPQGEYVAGALATAASRSAQGSAKFTVSASATAQK